MLCWVELSGGECWIVLAVRRGLFSHRPNYYAWLFIKRRERRGWKKHRKREAGTCLKLPLQISWLLSQPVSQLADNGKAQLVCFNGHAGSK